jgi:sugar phosphate isomerase/epimerase
MARIILSAFADEYSDSFEEQLQGLNKLGISHIEIRHVNKKNISVLTKTEVLEVKELLDKYGIKVSAIGSPLGKIRLDGDLDGHIETAKRVFEYANILGAKFVRMFSFYAPAGKDILDMKDEAFAAVGRLLDAAREYGVVLCHENEA